MARNQRKSKRPSAGPLVAPPDAPVFFVDRDTGGRLLANSIRLRNPYIDPLNHLQVAMLRRLRRGKLSAPDRVTAQRVVALTVNGIAGGLKNTG